MEKCGFSLEIFHRPNIVCQMLLITTVVFRRKDCIDSKILLECDILENEKINYHNVLPGNCIESNILEPGGVYVRSLRE